MSERFTASVNVNDSKNTRLPVAEEFSKYRFGRDALAHVTRYLWVCEKFMELAKELKRPIKVLEVGCGDIYSIRTFVASFVVKKTDVLAEYVGVDIDDKSMARTRATAPKCVPMKLYVGDFTTGFLSRFADKEFDLLINLEVIEHVKPEFIPLFLREIARISHRAIVSTPNFTGGSGKLPEDHIKEWDTDELLGEMVKAGLKLRHRFGTFCQLNKAKKELLKTPHGEWLWNELNRTCSSDFISLFAARFIGTEAQNIIYELDSAR